MRTHARIVTITYFRKPIRNDGIVFCVLIEKSIDLHVQLLYAHGQGRGYLTQE